jgi:hypothetical protein
MELVDKETSKAVKELLPLRSKQVQDISHIEKMTDNMQGMILAMEWLSGIIQYRTSREQDQTEASFESIGMFHAEESKSSLYKLCFDLKLSLADKLLLVLAYTAQFKPSLLDPLLATKPDSKMRYREYGGLVDNTDGKLVPTLQTAVYLLAGKNDVKAGVYYETLRYSPLFSEQVIKLRSVKSDTDHPLFQLLDLDLAYYHFLTNGKKPKFEESEDFPAYLLQTNKRFEDLILKPATMEHLQGPMNFVRHYNDLFGNEETLKIIKPGYVVMLYGPPGTGKTMTAAVMGKELGVDVYAVNLSRIVSKYIGETEKNLEKVFNRLADKRCILFFDEADALFGKRTEVTDAKDRYANQEVAYLLQKIEQFPGLVILASNFRQNLDDAFKRRIINSILIPPPDQDLRTIMWKKSLPPAFQYDDEQMPEKLAERHSLTGANIANIIKLSCIEVLSQHTKIVSGTVLEHYIKFELIKEGKNSGA